MVKDNPDKNESKETEKKKETTIPTFVLKKIFPKDCARVRDEGGFIIRLINTIEPFLFSAPALESYIDSIKVKLDDEELDPRKIYIKYKDIEVPYANLTDFDGGRVNLGDEIEIIYKDDKKVEPTNHVLDIFIDAPEPVRIKFKTKFLNSIF